MSNHNFIFKEPIYLLAVVIFILSACNSKGSKVKDSNDSAHIDSNEGISDSDSETMNPNALEKMQFGIIIEANPEKVYERMTDEKGYRQWTSAFDSSSYYKGSWAKDSTIHFLSIDKSGSVMGMISKIKENIPGKLLSLEHYGMVMNGKEITEGEDIEAFKGAIDSYTFYEKDGFTELHVDTEIFVELKDYFLETWPKALESLKRICEQSN